MTLFTTVNVFYLTISCIYSPSPSIPTLPLLASTSSPLSFHFILMFITSQLLSTTHCLQKVGASVNPYASTVGIGVVRLIMGLVTSFLLRNFGRRPLFLISSSVMAISMFTSGYLTKEIIEGQSASVIE